MTWQGMHVSTGGHINDIEHIRQSVTDILTTPVGTRVMRRDYGSRLFDLVDQPQNGATRLKLMAATVMALLRWEPRITITHLSVELGITGSWVITMSAKRTDNGQSVTIEDIEITP